MTTEIAMIRLADLSESPFNPRTIFNEEKLDELAADLKTRGMLQPILAREHAGDSDAFYEVIVGHRRLRAAKLAGLESVPVVVTEMTDQEVLEAQLVENLKREDLTALEEAEGYRALREQGLSVDQIVERIKKSKAWIYARLKLCDLGAKGREAFVAGRLNASTALLVARIPDPRVQADAVKAIAYPRSSEEALSFRAAAELIQREFMLDLAKAPFDPSDTTLVPSAGGCMSCPKRTGAQPELFSDVSKATDLCSDVACYREKADADWKRREAAAGTGGPKVLGAGEAKRIFSTWGHIAPDAPYVEAESRCYDDVNTRSYKQLLGREFKERVVLARTPQGDLVELVPKDGLKRALNEAGKIKRPDGAATSSETKEEREARKAKEAVSDATETAIVSAVVAELERREPDKRLWRYIAEQCAARYFAGVLERRWPGEKEQDKAAATWIAKATEAQLRGFVLECLLETALTADDPERNYLLEMLKVDAKAIAADVKASFKQSEREAREAAKPQKKKRVVDVRAGESEMDAERRATEA